MHLDGLIALLIIIGLVTSISKSNKKKKAAQAQKAAKPAAQAGEVRIPYTREEWAQFLEQEHIPKPKAPPKPAAAKPEDVAKVAAAVLEKHRAQAAQRSVPTPAPAPSGSIAVDANQGVEGETEAEHAAHRMRAARAEARRRSECAEAQAVAQVNLQALRSAVVMKEILDKPVSLRPRRRYY